jgi:pimeloyl-ACP methyl ester carboxylesterase
VLDYFALQHAVVVGHSLGAYIAASLAVAHPDRVRELVLVDGGLTIPGTDGVDPDRFIEAFLGPTFARLKMTFPDRAAYRDWWAAHPALAGSDMDPAHRDEYADHDLIGDPPQLHSSIDPEVVRADGLDLLQMVDAPALNTQAVLLCAPRGLVDDPNPMQPVGLVREWAAQDPRRRRAIEVPDVNHYTIAFGRRGADVVAAEVVRALEGS